MNHGLKGASGWLVGTGINLGPCELSVILSHPLRWLFFSLQLFLHTHLMINTLLKWGTLKWSFHNLQTSGVSLSVAFTLCLLGQLWLSVSLDTQLHLHLRKSAGLTWMLPACPWPENCLKVVSCQWVSALAGQGHYGFHVTKEITVECSWGGKIYTQLYSHCGRSITRIFTLSTMR